MICALILLQLTSSDETVRTAYGPGLRKYEIESYAVPVPTERLPIAARRIADRLRIPLEIARSVVPEDSYDDSIELMYVLEDGVKLVVTESLLKRNESEQCYRLVFELARVKVRGQRIPISDWPTAVSKTPPPYDLYPTLASLELGYSNPAGQQYPVLDFLGFVALGQAMPSATQQLAARNRVLQRKFRLATGWFEGVLKATPATAPR